MLRAVFRALAFALTAVVLAAPACSGPPRQEDGTDRPGTPASAPAPGAPADVARDEGRVVAADRIEGVELVSRLGGEDEPLMLDVRSREEFAKGHIPGALNIPYDELPGRLEEIAEHREDEVVVYCRTGRRAKIAEAALSEAGFRKVRDLEGHMTAWNEARHRITEAVPCC
jgi:phage shock protein E